MAAHTELLLQQAPRWLQGVLAKSHPRAAVVACLILYAVVMAQA